MTGLDFDSLHLQIDTLFVCHPCGRIYGDLVSRIPGGVRPGQRQSCDCQATDPGGRWPDYDFPEALTLCRCCGRRVLLSGSRWSVWFCGDCRRAIRKINQAGRGHVIPIGRFTLLDQIGLDEDCDDCEVPSFVDELGDWFVRVERLENHARHVVQYNLRQFHTRPTVELTLSVYLERLQATPEVLQASVADLGRTFGVPTHLLADAADDIA